MDLFKFIGVLFSTNGEYEKLNSYEKNKNYFMTNRFMSIQYPQVADQLQQLRSDPTAILDYWHRSLSQIFNGTPGWIYTKTKKTKKQIADKHFVDVDTLKQYAINNDSSIRDVEYAIKLFPEDMEKELKEFEIFIGKGTQYTSRKKPKRKGPKKLL